MLIGMNMPSIHHCLSQEEYTKLVKNNVGRNIGDVPLDANGEEIQNAALLAVPNIMSGITYVDHNIGAVVNINIGS